MKKIKEKNYMLVLYRLTLSGHFIRKPVSGHQVKQVRHVDIVKITC